MGRYQDKVIQATNAHAANSWALNSLAGNQTHLIYDMGFISRKIALAVVISIRPLLKEGEHY